MSVVISSLGGEDEENDDDVSNDITTAPRRARIQWKAIQYSDPPDMTSFVAAEEARERCAPPPTATAHAQLGKAVYIRSTLLARLTQHLHVRPSSVENLAVLQAEDPDDVATSPATRLREALPIGHTARAQTARKVYRNLIAHCIACALVFLPYQAINRLDWDRAVQLPSLGGLTLSCLLAPTIVHKLGYKWTMVASFVAHCAYVVATYYGSDTLAMVASALLGFSLGPFWTAQGCFIAILATDYSDATGKDASVVVPRFFGMFFTLYQVSRLLGHPIAYGALNWFDDIPQSNSSQRLAYRFELTDFHGNYSRCGVHFCGDIAAKAGLPQNETAEESVGGVSGRAPAPRSLRVMVATYLVCCVVAIFLKVVLTSNLKPRKTTQSQLSGGERVAATIVLQFQKLMVLLFPLMFYNGLQQVFFFEFVNAYVICAFGEDRAIQTVFTCALAAVASSLVIGCLEKYVTRIVLLKLAVGLDLAVLFILKVRDLDKARLPMVFVLSAMWGVAHAVWQTTLCSLMTAVFQHCREAAFASFRLWQTLGLVTSLLLSGQLCMSAKMWVAGGTVLVGSALYSVMEILYRRQVNKPYYNIYIPVTK